MGAEFWSYFVPYQPDIRAALALLREQEFRAGRFYQPPEITPGFLGRLLGRRPARLGPPTSMRDALRIAGATGTRSILDIERIADRPDCGAVTPLSAEELRSLFGTEQPNRNAVEQSEALLERIERGQGVFVITYERGSPSGIFFAGYSFD